VSIPDALGAEEEDELGYLRRLANHLRAAISICLGHERAELAVLLDTARDRLESVLDEPRPTSTRLHLARARAEIALEVWRETIHIDDDGVAHAVH